MHALEALGPPDLQDTASGALSESEASTRWDRAFVLAELGLLSSARAELERLAANAPEPRRGLAKNRLATLGPEIPAAAVTQQLPGAMARLADGDTAPIRAWLDDHGFPNAMQQLRDSRPLDPDLGVQISEIRRLTGDRFPAEAWDEITAAAAGRAPAFLPGVEQLLAAQAAPCPQPPAATPSSGASGASEQPIDPAESAASQLAGVAPAWSARAALFQIVCNFRGQRYEETLAGLPDLRSDAVKRGWTDIEARTYWLEGLTLLQQGLPEASRGPFLASHDALIGAGEPGLAAAVLALDADAQALLGDLEESLEVRTRALASLYRYGPAGRTSVALEEGAFALDRAGFPRAALAFLYEARDVLGATTDPQVVVDQGSKVASALLRLGLVDQAMSEIERASTQASTMGTDEERKRAQAVLDATRGAALAERDPEGAIDAFTSAIREYERHDYGFLIVDALHQRGRVERRLGDTGAARQDFERAFAEATKESKKEKSWAQRALHAETQRALIDDLVDDALVQADPARALTWALRARRDNFDSGDATDKGQAASDRVTLVLFALPDRLVRWRLLGDSLAASQYPMERQKLLDMVGGFRSQVIRADALDRAGSQAAELFEIVLAPIRADLDAGEPIDIVADGSLMDLPFAALRESATGPTVAELSTWRLVQHPLASAEQSEIRPSALKLVVVSDPELAPTVANRLVPLPSARVEGRAVAKRFSTSELLEGADASHEKVEEALKNADVLHIAAHALARRDRSGAAAILLAGDTDANWRADEIATQHYTHLRLVVLSACETAIGFPTTLSGPMSIGQAFLSAGAEYVLVTQWPVLDRVSQRFMEMFYDQLEALGAPESALAATQRRFKTSTDPVDRQPKSWAGYYVAADRLSGSTLED